MLIVQKHALQRSKYVFVFFQLRTLQSGQLKHKDSQPPQDKWSQLSDKGKILSYFDGGVSARILEIGIFLGLILSDGILKGKYNKLRKV